MNTTTAVVHRAARNMSMARGLNIGAISSTGSANSVLAMMKSSLVVLLSKHWRSSHSCWASSWISVMMEVSALANATRRLSESP